MPDPTTDVDVPSPGVMPALVTPFADDESVDHDALAELVEWTIEQGVDGLVPCGTTGEFASMSAAERQAVVETTVETADGRVPVVAGAAGTTVDEVLSHAEAAAEVGADAALVTDPFFHSANAPAGNEEFFRRVADRTPLPLYLYNIPMTTGDRVAVETVAALAAHDAVHGIKDTSGDFSYFEDVLAATPDDFRVLQGFDDHFVGGAAMGSDGGINALANVVPDAFRALCDALDDGDLAEARRLQRDVLSPLFGVCLEHGFAPTTKVTLAVRGVVDATTVRPPLVELDEEGFAAVRETVEEAVWHLEEG